MEKNAQWNSTLSFILAMIGVVVGLGNIWRFSYVLYSNGGGSFFIPYLIAILLMGIPFLILEYGLGYNFKDSFPNILKKINPKFEFISWIIILLLFIVGIYYVVIIGWDLTYLFSSLTFEWGNDTAAYFANNVGGNSNLSDPISFLIPTTISVLLIWAIIWFISHRNLNDGIAKFSKIAIPILFILMIGIVIYSFTLPGASLGIKTLITPDWNMLLNIKVWLAAFSQIIFSLSLGQAIVITYASYLPDNSKLIDNAFLVVLSNSLFEIFTALGVFSILGYMSTTTGTPMTLLISEGTGLVFIVFPKIFNIMGPIGHILAPTLFIVILFAGLSSAIGMIEPVVNSVLHKFNISRRKSATILCIIGCIFSLMLTTNLGSYLIGIIDEFINEIAILLFIAIQCIIFSWVFDIQSLIPALNEKSRFKVGKSWVATIKYVLPIFIVVIWILGIFDNITNPNSFSIIIDLLITIIVLIVSGIFYKMNAD
ncbi:sodium-dependent transporter [Methanobrevibacter sp.]|uniref:sodium-dependent transporter n=1 Tax=Methanobrevibacter sp. TaxID=66852 RepID=UPI0038902F77